MIRTRTGEITLDAARAVIIAKGLRPLPEKYHGLRDTETRYRQRYLDLIANRENMDVFRLRSRVIGGFRRFLDGLGFLEVDTPVLVPVAAGAHARPFITHHNALDQQLYLRIATELYLKRLIVGGFDKVYEIGRVFRNEGIDQDHNPEFTLLESYEAYADYNDVMAMVEEMIAAIALEATGDARVAAADGRSWILPRPGAGCRCGRNCNGAAASTWMPFRRRMTGCGSCSAALPRWAWIPASAKAAGGSSTSCCRAGGAAFAQPVFMLDYPEEMSPLAKAKPGAPGYVERFEAFAGGMEIANAYSELNDPQVQRRRFEEQEEIRRLYQDEEVDRRDDDFLTAMEYGMPPTGGLGIGIDRLVMLLAGQRSIRDVVLFPQMRALSG